MDGDGSQKNTNLKNCACACPNARESCVAYEKSREFSYPTSEQKSHFDFVYIFRNDVFVSILRTKYFFFSLFIKSQNSIY